MRILNYKICLDYFKDLVTQHKIIKSFVGYSAEELATEMAKIKGIPDPILVLYNYEGKLDGNNQRTFANRTISFAILKQVKKVDDFTAQYQAIADCEELGLSVLSRVNYDSKGKKVEWLYNNFIKDSVRFNEVKYKSSEGLFGMEFSFDLKTLEPLSIVADDWEDITELC
jgi:hypothetical protein